MRSQDQRPTRSRPSARPVTVVVRAVAGPAAEGRLVGQVEVVDTGDVVTVTDVAGLLAILRELALGDAEGG